MKDNKRKRHIPGEWIAAAILVALIIGGVFIAYRVDESKRAAVAGTYASGFQISDSGNGGITVYYKFDEKKGTYEELWNEKSLMTGKYTVDGNTLTTVSDGNDQAASETEEYIVDGRVLIPKSYMYEGAIPDGDTFDAQCTLTDSAGAKYTLTFRADGTYTYAAGEDADDTFTGTYERAGSFIHRTRADGNALTDFYVYDGRLAGVVYTKE